MDFLNQLDADNNKEENSLFTFNEKNDNNKGGSLPFPFSSQSSVGGGNENMFLNDMKSEGGESFVLSQFENDNQNNNNNNNNNFGGLDFLNTICEVPESSNNIFNSQNDNTFLNANAGKNQGGLDFINAGNENDDNNNLDFDKFQNNINKDEPINIDINNLFKSTKTKKDVLFGKTEESDKNENFEIDNLLNIPNNNKVGVNNENSDNPINPNKNNNIMNNNNINSNTSLNSINSFNNINNMNSISNNNTNINKDEIKDQNINIDINNPSINKNNNKLPSIQSTNNNNISYKPMQNLINKNSNSNNLNKEKAFTSTHNNNINKININPSSISDSTSNPIINNINVNIKEIKDNKENIPSFQNISIKPTITNKQQNINLDDIDKIISQNTIKENKAISTNNQNNSFTIKQNFLQGKTSDNNNNINNNNRIDNAKDSLKFLSNELSNIFTSSIIKGKRTELEQNDKDLQNFENLLGFTKENITSKSQIKKNQNISEDKNLSLYKQISNNAKIFANNTQKANPPIMKQIPSDSFDKKSQLIKLSKNDEMFMTQKEATSKSFPKDEEKSALPSKIEMIQKYNDLASRLNKIREKAKEYRNFGNYFSQLIIANENYNVVYPNVLNKLLKEYNKQTDKLISLMKIKNNKMNEMNNEFFEEVKKYSLASPNKI